MAYELEGESWMARNTFSPNKPKWRTLCTNVRGVFYTKNGEKW